MRTHSTLRRNGTVGYFYYDCNKHDNYGHDACPQKLLRVEEVEASVLGFVSGLLKDPDRLRVGMQALIENERGSFGETRREKRLFGPTSWKSAPA
jgi:hypothetical protein